MSKETATASRSVQELAGKYLTFTLDREEYGLPVLKVREIIKMMDITAVPQVPACVKGVINLRGKVIPVIDLRLKFGFDAVDYTDRTSIIVVEVALQAGRVMMGIVVDEVSEVLNISIDEIEEVPQFGDRVCTDYMRAIAKLKGSVKILLDLDRILGSDNVAAGLTKVA
jgi:purine-binding chemotaxis protein CheW